MQDEACMHSSPRGAIGSSQELQTEEPPAWGSLPCQGKALQSWVEGKKKKSGLKIKQKLAIYGKASTGFLISLRSTHGKAFAIRRAGPSASGLSSLPRTSWDS